jgi:DNA invertase Pin-like site-specific DNA recombinase
VAEGAPVRTRNGRPQRVPIGRRMRIQAVVIFGLLAGEGFAILLLDGPVWLTLIYVVLGIAFAIGRLRLGSHAPAGDSPPRAEVEPSPEPVAAQPQAPERRAIGYVRVSRDGLGSDLAKHRAAIRAWADAQGVELLALVHDVEPDAGDTGTQPALRGVLERISAKEAETLVVESLGHLSSSLANLPPLLRWFSDSGRSLVAIDLRIDTATEAGRLAAAALARVGGWERDRLSARTRRGLEAARARGSGNGRAAVGDVPELQDRIAGMRDAGMTLQAIADVLNEEGVPTLRGGAMWRPSSVQRATGYRRPPSHAPGVYLPASGLEDDGADSAA